MASYGGCSSRTLVRTGHSLEAAPTVTATPVAPATGTSLTDARHVAEVVDPLEVAGGVPVLNEP